MDPARSVLRLVPALLALACAHASGSAVAGEAILALRTRAELVERLDGVPRCAKSSPEHEVCRWRIDASNPAWQGLAALAGTDASVNVLCELNLDGSPAQTGACTVHARAREEFRGAAAALARLEQARELAALSRLVGDVPDECRAGTRGEQLCIWHVNSSHQGYEIIGLTADTTSRRVNLTCRLPMDGAARESDSCGTRIGR